MTQTFSPLRHKDAKMHEVRLFVLLRTLVS